MMKRYICSVAFLFMGLLWLAEAQASACELLVKTTHSGYVSNGYNDVLYRTRVMCNGDVMKGYQVDPFSPWKEQMVSRLSEESLSRISSQLSSLISGDISYPSGPEYADGPTSIYAGMDGSGAMVVFYKYYFGQWGKLAEFPFSEELKEFIDSY